MRKYFCVILLMLFCSLRGGAQQLVVGTDVMLDAFQTPNLGAELITGERTSISLNVLGNYKPWGNNTHNIKFNNMLSLKDKINIILVSGRTE